MLRYTLYQKNPASHYIYIDLELETRGEQTIELQLPAWRPGRYELGNFAKNIKRVDVWGKDNVPLQFRKTGKDRWEVQASGEEKIRITYSYYAAELNAGSCYADTTQLYVNPVHLCMYVPERMNEEHEIALKIPDNYKIATVLPLHGRAMRAKDFHELADSPFIASAELKSESFKVGGKRFHLHFQGECVPDFDRIKKDFTAFTKTQFEFWGEFPVNEYHYLFQITPLKFYHGVEHSACTVIALGPGYALNEGTTYEDLLGVSSHELFHTWNVKLIRPAEMLPYDYSRENFARTGFVYEGFTTYYGDKLLLSSEVFTIQQYFVTLEERLTKHFHNYGRFNLSVADSSWDTWLDGYVPGAPYRKTSIYDEGCLVAFLLDVHILQATGLKRSLRDVCILLLERFGKKGKGYSEEDIQTLCDEVCGQSLQDFFAKHVYGTEDMTSALEEVFTFLGLKMNKVPSPFPGEHLFGFKLAEGSNKISLVAPYSPAWKAGLFAGDEIIAVNGVAVRASVSQWLAYFAGEADLQVAYVSNERLKTAVLQKDRKGQSWFFKPVLSLMETASPAQTAAFGAWKRL